MTGSCGYEGCARWQGVGHVHAAGGGCGLVGDSDGVGEVGASRHRIGAGCLVYLQISGRQLEYVRCSLICVSSSVMKIRPHDGSVFARRYRPAKLVTIRLVGRGQFRYLTPSARPALVAASQPLCKLLFPTLLFPTLLFGIYI